jgi:hypothetical protein
MTRLLAEPYGTDPLTNQRVVVKDTTAALQEYPYIAVPSWLPKTSPS